MYLPFSIDLAPTIIRISNEYLCPVVCFDRIYFNPLMCIHVFHQYLVHAH